MMEKKKKLLFIYYKLWKSGGINRALTNLANELVGEYDVSILILVKSDESFYELDPRIKLICVDSYDHWTYTVGCKSVDKYGSWLPKKQNIKNYLYDFGAYQTLNKWLNKNHQAYDTIITCQYKLSIQMALNSTFQKKTIAWEHTDHDVGGMIFNRLREKSYDKLKTIITINKPSYFYYKEKNPNTLLISNIIGEPFESVQPRSFAEIENNICFVGRLDKDKNVEELIEIFKLAKIDESWKLFIIGDGPEYARLEIYIQENNLKDKVFLEGIKSVQEVAAYLQNSKIFAFTSLREAFGNVLVEAMMCGNALIAYDCDTGPADIVNEKNGFLIPLQDQKKFIEKLEYLTNQPETLDKLMRSSYEESFSWKKDTSLKQWKEIL